MLRVTLGDYDFGKLVAGATIQADENTQIGLADLGYARMQEIIKAQSKQSPAHDVWGKGDHMPHTEVKGSQPQTSPKPIYARVYKSGTIVTYKETGKQHGSAYELPHNIEADLVKFLNEGHNIRWIVPNKDGYVTVFYEPVTG